MIDFKKNYFLRNMIDLEKTLAEYLTDADNNYVIIDNGDVIVWVGDKSPVVFGDEMGVLNELGEIGGLDDKGELLPNIKVMTEQEFIYKYCLSALEDWFKDKAKKIGEDDGICHIIWLDDRFVNFVSNDNVSDVLGIYNSNEENGLTFLVSDSNDSLQVWYTIDDFHINEIIDFVGYVEHEEKKFEKDLEN